MRHLQGLPRFASVVVGDEIISRSSLGSLMWRAHTTAPWICRATQHSSFELGCHRPVLRENRVDELIGPLPLDELIAVEMGLPPHAQPFQ